MTAMLSQSPGLQREHAHQAVRLDRRESERSAEILEGRGLGVRVQVTKNTISPY